MSDIRTPSDSPGRGDVFPGNALPDDASSDSAAEEALPAREQLFAQIVSLRQAYRQIHEYLQDVQLELAERESQVDRHLRQLELAERESQVNRHLRAAIELLDDSARSPPAPTSPVPATHHNPGSRDALHIHTLGQFQVIYHGQRISLGSNKNGRALFRYLVTLADRRAHKDVLAELFWPDDPPEKANHKLHIAVSSLRHALQEALLEVGEAQDAILFSDDYYLLSPALQIVLDTDVFLAHLAAAQKAEESRDLSTAIVEYEASRAMYQGDFMAQDLYADWTVTVRARFEEMYLTLLGRLANHYLDQERYAESVACCRQILARDSFREDAYRQLMRCYSHMGRRNQALVEFHNCVQVLQQELGVAPTRATQKLYEHLLHREQV
jgi:DNA-binding SARP family transcriptional activator